VIAAGIVPLDHDWSAGMCSSYVTLSISTAAIQRCKGKEREWGGMHTSPEQ